MTSLSQRVEVLCLQTSMKEKGTSCSVASCVKFRVADVILLTLVNMLNLNQPLAKDDNQKYVFY